MFIEVASVADETQSLATNMSEEEQLVVFDGTEDDIFENGSFFLFFKKSLYFSKLKKRMQFVL